MSDAGASAERADDVVSSAMDSDAELLAIRAVLGALVPLKKEARARVVDYVFKRLNLIGDTSTLGTAIPALLPSTESPTPSALVTGSQDIRSLRSEKSPRSANEMAALAAYYLSEVAPHETRKPTIDAEDLKKYFKQAQFKLPSSPKMTLVNAKNAGYLEATTTAGQYRLNPVGYNLVVHNLPHNKSVKKRKRAAKPKGNRRK